MKIAGCCKNSKGINVKALQQQGFLRSEIRTIKIYNYDFTGMHL